MPKYYFERLEYMDFLIRSGKSGTLNEMALKLGVSRRTAFEYLGILESLGAEIEYNSVKKVYCYKCKGKFNFKFIKDV